MKQYEKDFDWEYRKVVLQASYPRDLEGKFNLRTTENFIIAVLGKKKDISDDLKIEDIKEKSAAVKSDMRTLMYLLYGQQSLIDQLDALTSKLMKEYEKEMKKEMGNETRNNNI